MTSPARHISKAAELVREFNHTSRSTGKDWEYPSASYGALGALSHLVGMLPQALEQSVRPVMHTYEHGRVKIDGNGDPDAAVRYLREALDRAVRAASALTEAVDRMHSETSPLGLDTRGLPEFEDGEGE
ncbi:hypothetical protein AB0D27_11305 [Streptomyces sp. NPDC048415]|uniref:hypothetical protein n=1 Tax=Streptomyces sp. NPDC048415 TaxID=3154822 RepID=UPI00341C8138